ncbi:MAG: LysM peptidoglycan-binding domain-containing protein [Mariprofundales bacterium]
MKHLAFLITLLLCFNAVAATTDTHHTSSDLLQIKSDIQQPYIVREGDTLWDIANHFFRNPHRWLHIWEQNLTITNPDLIYPGNKIWFNPKQKESGGLTIIRPHPQIHMRPVERESQNLDRSLVLSILARQDLIAAGSETGVGHVVDGADGRLNYGAGDHIYIALDQPANRGDHFDIFRSGEAITSPGGEEPIGVLISHVGQLRIDSHANNIYRATIIRAFEEVSRGDHLKPAQTINARITPTQMVHPTNGKVIHIRNSASEAGQQQILAIDLGTKDGITQGSLLSVQKKGRLITDQVTGKPLQLPAEKIATILVISPQSAGSLALVTQSSTSINLGDTVIGKPSQP